MLNPKVLTVLLIISTDLSATIRFVNGNRDYAWLYNRSYYHKKADINIGAVIGMTQISDSIINVCSDQPEPYIWQMTQAFAYAVDYVNADSELLKNAKLGFALEDGCYRYDVAVIGSLKFLPRTCKSPQQFDVIGLIGTSDSDTASLVAALYSIARIPMVGYQLTSDELSDKKLYPYYFRIVPPDKYLVEAMLKFISKNDWSYISIVYSAGHYGEKAFEYIWNRHKDYNLCIATKRESSLDANFTEIAEALLAKKRARVVILFMEKSEPPRLFNAIDRLHKSNFFLWIGSELWSTDYNEAILKYGAQAVNGTISFSIQKRNQYSRFTKYMTDKGYDKDSTPMMKRAWEIINNCSFADRTCTGKENVVKGPGFFNFSMSSHIVDTVLTFAHAADRLLKDHCPEAKGKKARKCIDGRELYQYVKNVSFKGLSKHIKFDDNQDILGKYSITQIISNGNDLVWNDVGIYDIVTSKLAFSPANMSWSHMDKVDRLVPLPNNTIDDGHPESICSAECKGNQRKIEQKVTCCWECWKCNKNEHLSSNHSKCLPCPRFAWPDSESNYTKCKFIPVTFTPMTETLPLLLIVSALFALAITICTIYAYIKLRHIRAIKASSRELCHIQLFGLVIGYINVLELQLVPTDLICKLAYLNFSISFALLYCPLLLKTMRIYRIFSHATKSAKKLRFISGEFQLFMSAALVTIQILLSLISIFVFSPSAKKEQPSATTQLVEISCDMTVPGFSSFLGYNLLVITLCFFLAFKTRRLPNNFNESRYINKCLFTTLIIWLAFIPSYFMGKRAFVRSLLLSLALLFNHTVALCFLFLPRIYAAIYITDTLADDRIRTDTITRTTIQKTPSSVINESSNKMASSLSPSELNEEVQQDPVSEDENHHRRVSPKLVGASSLETNLLLKNPRQT